MADHRGDGLPAALTRVALAGLVAGLLYFLVGLAVLVPEPWQIPVGRFVYPSAGIGFGLVFVYGTRMWPAVAAAAAGVTWLTGGGPLFIVGTAIGNAAEAVIATAVLARRRRDGVLRHLSDVGLFVLAAVLGALASATLGVATLALSDDLAGPVLWRIGWMWILGHSLGTVLFGSPFVTLAWGRVRRAEPRFVEGAAMLVGVALVSLVAFSRVPGSSGSYPLQYIGYPFLIWAALRLPLTWVLLANLVLGASAMAWTAYGVGPYHQDDLGASLVYAYVFALVSWLTTVVMAVTVSARRAADAASAQREGAYRALVEQAAEGIFVLTDAGAITDVNQAAAPMMGIEPDRVLGRPFVSLVSGDEGERFRTLLRDLRPGETDLVDWTRTRADGSAIDLQAGVKRLSDGGVHVFIRDVTRARELQRRLDRTHRMEAVGLLAGGVAHDFNNLLTVIMGHGSRALESVEPDHAAARHLQGILRAARQSTDLTTQLLTFARRNPGRARVVDVDQVVDDAEDMMRRVLGERVRYLRVSNGDEDEVPTVHMDPVQLEQVLLNLVLNARDAMPRGGEVTVKTGLRRHGEDRQVVIEVRDTGAGVRPEVAHRVFEPFFSTKIDKSRTGLGLAVSRRIVEDAGGELDFDSTPGRGTTFRVTLPRIDGTPGAEAWEAEAAGVDEGGGRVLLVEDGPELRELIQEGLEARGYAVTAVPDAEAALDRFRELGSDLDLVLTDVVLPGASGTEMAAQIRRELPEVEVLFMSGYDINDLAEEAVRGFEGERLLRKPFTMPDLATAVAEVMEARSRRRGRRAEGGGNGG